jgi:hypothetical protein
MSCPKGQEKDNDGLCYPRCDNGYSGVGPVCWGQCSVNTKDIGALCNKDSYDRGIGKIPSKCPDDKENQNGLCYVKCNNGYSGDGPVCWGICPSDFKDIGISCSKIKDYGRGSGYVTKRLCERSDARGAKENGCEKYLDLWYPKCDKGFKSFGCCICNQECPSGFKDEGKFCLKPTYKRGAGTVPDKCEDDKDEDAGLCYDKCAPRFKGVATTCWGVCGGETTDSGTFCTKKTYGRGAGTIPAYNWTWLWITLGVILFIIIFIVIIVIYNKSKN